jgi:peptidoglycan/xylan/chitin deacetylase (PgdA/CDA1 family)
MLRRRVLAALLAWVGFFGLAASAHAAEVKPAADKQIAYFQPKTIFHNGLRGTHTVALTFDDGPNENTTAVLNALDRYDVKATFFIVGQMARTHLNILSDVAARGHLLANHTNTHAKLAAVYDERPELLVSQIKEVNDLIAPFQQNTTLFFRAPYGYWKSAHAKILNDDPVLRQYVGPIFWDVGGETVVDREGYVRTSADWNCWERGWKAATCAKGYLREIENKDGGVVLMHCVNPKAAALVAAVVPVLQREGFRFVRLDALKEYDRYKTPPERFRPAIAMDDFHLRR